MAKKPSVDMGSPMAYAPITKFIPIVGSTVAEMANGLNELLPAESVEDLKEKIDTILKESEKKIVVIIDDIDRLDKNEIHSIFKLVKLTADFYNTTYILSFDENMVAAAIGERFGEGDKNAGKNFLEKIIQVPLQLPITQPEALQQLCFDIINDFFASPKFELNEKDSRSFSLQFQSNILLRLKTPRLAIRYGNSLSFSIPLLYGEVNMSDLLLIEAIKIFYPGHYDFIKINSDLFIGSFGEQFGNTRSKEKVDLLNKYFDDSGNDLSAKEKKCIKDVLVHLFPKLNEIYNNIIDNSKTEIKLHREMKISSPKHFSRYFTYTVTKGDISDTAFRNFIAEVATKTETEVGDMIKQIITDSSPERFLNKLRTFEEEYDWAIAKRIGVAIATNSNLFPKQESQDLSRLMLYEQPYGQSQIFIIQVIKMHKSKNEAFEFTKYLFNISKYFEYALGLNSWINRDKEQQIFEDKLLDDLDYVLICRAIKEAGEISIFEKFDDTIAYLVTSWSKVNYQELNDYYHSFMAKNPKESIWILRLYAQTMWNTLFPQLYKTDLLEEQYKLLVSIFDKDDISTSILKIYSIEEIEESEVRWVGRNDNTQTDINIVRQFFHWKNQIKNE